MTVNARWDQTVVGRELLDPPLHSEIAYYAFHGAALGSMQFEDEKEITSQAFTIILPESGAVIRPRVVTRAVGFLSCVAIGDAVTLIFLHLGKIFAINNFPVVVMALATILLFYFSTSRRFGQLLTLGIARLPKNVCDLFFEETSPISSQA